MQVTAVHKQIARTVAAAFGQDRSRVHVHKDDHAVSAVAVVTAADSPDPGVHSCATIHLSDHDTGKFIEGKPLRVELVGAAYDRFDQYSNIVATCAFYHINDHLPLHPGAIYMDAITIYDLGYAVQHCLLTLPFLWDEEQLPDLTFDDRIVSWLQVIPISEAERQYAAQHGVEALEDLLQQHRVDVCDLARPSVI